jgi:hypothetical protein
MRLVSRLLPGCCGLLLAASAPYAQETVIYRCTDAGGAVTLQNDKPCAAGMKQDIRRVGTLPTAPAPRRPAPAVQADLPPAGGQFELVVGPQQQLPASDIPAAERVPPPTLYQCRTWDEDDYIGDIAEPEPRCAPLQTTDANGDPNGGAGSACDMVRDTCTEASGEALCVAWRRKVGEAEFRAKFASEREGDALKAEYERLAKILADSNCTL